MIIFSFLDILKSFVSYFYIITHLSSRIWRCTFSKTGEGLEGQEGMYSVFNAHNDIKFTGQ